MALLGCYAVGIDALVREIGAWPAPLSAALGSTLLRVALVAATFPLLQRWLRRALERWLFHDVYRYAPTLQRLSAEIAGLLGVGAIATHVLDRVGRTLDLSWAALTAGTAPPVDAHRWGDCPVDGDLFALLNRNPAGQRPTAAQHPGRSGQLAPLVAEGETIGVLAVGPKRHDVELQPEDQALLATLAPLVATALRNALLVDQLKMQVAALNEREQALAALSGQLLNAHEEERKRISLDIHDDPLARVVLLIRDLDELADQPRAEHCRRAAEEIDEALRAICNDLRPPELDDMGLPAGLESLVGEVRVRRSDLRAVLEVETADGRCFGRLDRGLETALYRAAQEALNNCLKHAQASEVRVTLRREGARIRLQVADDGRGCNPPERKEGGLKGLGLLGMRERLRPWAGVVDVEPNRPHGTKEAGCLNGEDGTLNSQGFNCHPFGVLWVSGSEKKQVHLAECGELATGAAVSGVIVASVVTIIMAALGGRGPRRGSRWNARRTGSPMPGTATSAGTRDFPPPRRALLRVVPIGQSQRRDGLEVTLIALEQYSNGFVLTCTAASAVPPVGRYDPSLSFVLTDNRGPACSAAGGGTDRGPWLDYHRSCYQFTLAFDPAARELRVKVTARRQRSGGGARYEDDQYDFAFTVQLPPGRGAVPA